MFCINDKKHTYKRTVRLTCDESCPCGCESSQRDTRKRYRMCINLPNTLLCLMKCKVGFHTYEVSRLFLSNSRPLANAATKQAGWQITHSEEHSWLVSVAVIDWPVRVSPSHSEHTDGFTLMAPNGDLMKDWMASRSESIFECIIDLIGWVMNRSDWTTWSDPLECCVYHYRSACCVRSQLIVQNHKSANDLH